jgi:hypothetical protein
MSLCRIFAICMCAGPFVGGIVAWLLGSPVWHGVVYGILIGQSPIMLFLTVMPLLLGAMALWRPEYPRCLCGRRSYEYVASVSNQRSQYRCERCKRDFLLDCNTFQLMNGNGVATPYMTHSERGR